MSSYTEGQTHQLVNALESVGFKSDDLTMMGQDKGLLVNLLGVLRGTHEISEREVSLFLECEVGGRTKDELVSELEANGMFVSDWAKDIMSKPAWTSGEKETVRFGRATVKELGFTHKPTWSEVLERIEGLGHAKCQPQDGPAIRLTFKDQPVSDWFWCAMDLITGSDGNPNAFNVNRNDGKRWLYTLWFYPTDRLGLARSVVFRLRKSFLSLL